MKPSVFLRSAPLLALAVLIVPPPTAAAAPAFEAPFLVSATPSPVSGMTVADANGDGAPDILLHSQAGVISVHLGSPGAPPPPLSPATTTRSSRIASGDLNHDGHVDAVLVGPTSTIMVLLGAGDGTFGPATAYATDGRPRSIVLADLNEDGHLDVAVTSSPSAALQPGRVSTWIGLGNGQLGARVDVIASTVVGLGDLLAGDINEDGHVDLLWGDTSPIETGVHALRGNGDGTFQPQQWLFSMLWPAGLAGGDLNGDGFFDIVAADNDLGLCVVGMGHGDGTFSQSSLAAGWDPTAVAIVDVNADGLPDLAVSNTGSDDLMVFLNTDGDTFVRSAIVSVTQFPGTILPFDWTSDGHPDLLVVVRGGLAVLTGNGDGTFGTPTFSVSDGALAVAVGDLNGDGRPDVATVCRDVSFFGSMSVRLGQPGRSFAPPINTPLGDYYQGAVMDDVNHDGFVDVVAAGYYFVTFFPGDGTGALGPRADFPALNARSPVLADLNQDGHLDLVLVEDTVTFRLGNGAGGFAAPQALATPSAPNAVRAGDLNDDGLPDLVAASAGAGGLSVFLNLGGGLFAPRVDYPAGTEARDLGLGDFDNDGNLDVAVANRVSNSVALFRGDGTGLLVRIADMTGVSAPIAVATLDANHDGRLDLAVVNFGWNATSVHHGLGDGSFAAPENPYGSGNDIRSVVAADMDLDGETDLVVPSPGNELSELTGNFAVLWNRGQEPIALSLMAFNAARESDGVRVTWEVPEHRQRCLFTLYRCPPRGVRAPVAPTAFTGHARYSVLDREAPAGELEYWLRETTEGGGGDWLGPARVLDVDSGGRLALGPNPARGPVTVTFGLETAGPARLDVLDVGGRLVTRLVDQDLAAGPHVMAWDVRDREGRRLGAGAYFVRLRSAGTTQVQRILVLP